MRGFSLYQMRRRGSRCRVLSAGFGLALLSPLVLTGLGQAAGSVDPSFGRNGKVVTKIASTSAAHAIALQADGKIVVAGESSVRGRLEFVLARYRRNGSLDPAFGRGGKVLTPIGVRAFASAIAVQHDGRIILAGGSDNGQRVDFALARYNRGGSLDVSFGSHGVLTTALGDSYSAASAVAVQPNGRIVAAGSTEWDFALARYNSSGRLDKTFGSGGTATTSFGGPRDRANALALQHDGKIVVAGRTGAYEEGDFALARFGPNGSLDPTFGSGGKVTTAVQHLDEIHALALETDGRILAAGESSSPPGSPRRFALARYKQDGSLDLRFGGGSPRGTVTTSVGSDSAAYALLRQRDGKIVLAGTATRRGGKYLFALARYSDRGQPDPSFGKGTGTVTTSLSSGNDVAQGLALDPDGKIVAAGSADEEGSSTFALVRYLAFTCRVPKVTGMVLAKARHAIVRAHCSVGRITLAFSPRVPSGRVSSQRPRPDSKRPQGTEVRLSVSRGVRPPGTP